MSKSKREVEGHLTRLRGLYRCIHKVLGIWVHWAGLVLDIDR